LRRIGKTRAAEELRVASLAALGHTNREIGRRLYVTVSTVEQHLTRVYRKLKVNSRADLPAGLSLNGSTGVISGTPTAAGTSSVVIKVTDAAANTATLTVSWTVS